MKKMYYTVKLVMICHLRSYHVILNGTKWSEESQRFFASLRMTRYQDLFDSVILTCRDLFYNTVLSLNIPRHCKARSGCEELRLGLSAKRIETRSEAN